MKPAKGMLAPAGGLHLNCRSMSITTIDINHTPPLGELLKLIAAGGEVVLEEAGKPVARLVPAAGQTAPAKRTAGLHEGQGWMSDDFDAPLPDDFWNGRV